MVCSWTGNLANCQTVDTALIGADDSIRVCWHGKPIGNVGLDLSELVQNFSDLKQKTIEKRDCKTCIKKEICIKCLFRHPLSSEEYCEYKKRYDTANIADFLKLTIR